jgi:hypothetical protein
MGAIRKIKEQVEQLKERNKRCQIRNAKCRKAEGIKGEHITKLLFRHWVRVQTAVK